MSCQDLTAVKVGEGLCGHTAQHYLDLMCNLLPMGAAWPARDRIPSTQLSVIGGLSSTMSAFNDALCQYLACLDPCNAGCLVDEFEQMLGLPDPCLRSYVDNGSGGYIIVDNNPTTLEGRMAAVCARLSAQGGQDASYYIQVLAALGYTVTIPRQSLFYAGWSAGNYLYTGGAPGQFVINSTPSICTLFYAGWSAGNYLSHCDAQALCIIERIKPAHLQAIIH